jgi:hypothetical protein
MDLNGLRYFLLNLDRVALNMRNNNTAVDVFYTATGQHATDGQSRLLFRRQLTPCMIITQVIQAEIQKVFIEKANPERRTPVTAIRRPSSV